ncbi:MAG: hypothetical protein WBX22_26315 [Silvibacterium sp.]
MLFALLAGAMSAFSQAPASTTDTDQINALMANLSSHAKTPADALDPEVQGDLRGKNLGHFSAQPYDLSVTPNSSAMVVSGATASVPVRIHYKAEDGNSLDASATAQFVKRDGVWYFANYDFMKWPVVLIVVLLICVSVGIAYAATVLVLWSRLAKQRTRDGSVVKIFIPLFWPSLFRR